MTASEIGANAQEQLKQFISSSHVELLRNRTQIASSQRQKLFAVRSTVIACFNLIEAYLNGIAWDYLRTADTDLLSKSKQKAIGRFIIGNYTRETPEIS